jgi:hypothetical protein
MRGLTSWCGFFVLLQRLWLSCGQFKVSVCAAYDCIYGARWGRDSILFASSSFLKRSCAGSQ